MSESNSMRISNYNYALGPVILGGIVAPVLVCATLGFWGYHFATGMSKSTLNPAIGCSIFALVSVLLGVPMMLGSALEAEFGSNLRIRGILGWKELNWSDVTAIRFVQEKGQLLKLGDTSLTSHLVLIIETTEEDEYKIKVGREQLVPLIALFENSPDLAQFVQAPAI